MFKLRFSAAAFACLLTFAVAAAVFLHPLAAFAAEVAPVGDKAVVLPYGDWIVAGLNVLVPVLVSLLAGVATWAIHTYVPIFGAFVSQGLVQRIVQNATDYATNAIDGAAKGEQLTIPVGSAVIAKAAQRAVDQVPAWLLKLAGGPAGVAEKVFRTLHLEPGSTAANVLAPALAQLPGSR